MKYYVLYRKNGHIVSISEKKNKKMDVLTQSKIEITDEEMEKIRKGFLAFIQEGVRLELRSSEKSLRQEMIDDLKKRVAEGEKMTIEDIINVL